MDQPASTVFVLGLGYVGLPLAFALSRFVEVIGFDESAQRRAQLRRHEDVRLSVGSAELEAATQLTIDDGPERIARADFIVVCVPTPIDEQRRPDLGALRRACGLVGRNLSAGATVVFESTVFPGATEEVCVPLLEQASGLRWKDGFSVAYSPERINPGDTAHGLADVMKVVAGDTEETLERVSALYRRVVPAGIHRAPSIRVAEAAKVLENVQRDVNIALMNEVAGVLRAMGIDTLEVLAAAETKWNFPSFRPGLVGGHCVAVDPYYLISAARAVGVEPSLMAAARQLNEGEPESIAARIMAALTPDRQVAVLVMGVAFKRDCTDVRNSKVPQLVRALRERGCLVDCIDPIVDRSEAADSSVELLDEEPCHAAYEAIVLAVDHAAYRTRGCQELLRPLRDGGLVVDLHGTFEPQVVRQHGFRVLRP